MNGWLETGITWRLGHDITFFIMIYNDGYIVVRVVTIRNEW